MKGKVGGESVSKNMDTKEAWNEKDQTITVTEGNGFLYNLTLRAKVDSSPSDIYSILTDPNTVSIFRSIKECTYRRVLEEDGKGRRKLEVGHRAISRFLFMSVTFETHLYVWEDDVERTIKFQMARPGMMQKFDGCWRVEPFTQTTLDAIYHPERLTAGHKPHQHQQHNTFPRLPLGPFNAAGLLGFLSGHHHPHKAPEPTESLVALEQNILPRGHMPPGVKGLVRGLCAHQIRTMMEDLRNELRRRKNGTSTTASRPLPHSQTGAPGSKCRAASAPSSCSSPSPASRSSSSPAAAARITASSPLACICCSTCWSHQHQDKDLWEATAPIQITIRL